MKRLIPLLIAVSMVAGCVNKRNTCAQLFAGAYPTPRELKEIHKRLGIEAKWLTEPRDQYLNRARVEQYCEFYKG